MLGTASGCCPTVDASLVAPRNVLLQHIACNICQARIETSVEVLQQFFHSQSTFDSLSKIDIEVIIGNISHILIKTPQKRITAIILLTTHIYVLSYKSWKNIGATKNLKSVNSG